MTITFTRDGDYASARIVARSRQIAIGAVFPPQGGTDTKWHWRVWIDRSYAAGREGKAPSYLAARNDLLTAWEEFLRAAGLQQIEATQ